jgi:hypothetical protein
LRDLNASCRPSISAWSKCIYMAWMKWHWCTTREMMNKGFLTKIGCVSKTNTMWSCCQRVHNNPHINCPFLHI